MTPLWMVASTAHETRHELGHHSGDCSFETILHRFDLGDPVLWALAAIIHEADLHDERFDAPDV